MRIELLEVLTIGIIQEVPDMLRGRDGEN